MLAFGSPATLICTESPSPVPDKDNDGVIALAFPEKEKIVIKVRNKKPKKFGTNNFLLIHTLYAYFEKMGAMFNTEC